MRQSRSERKTVRSSLSVVCALALLGGLAVTLQAQTPAPASQQQPATQTPKTDANPFPEDTGSVPVMPSTPAALEAQGGAGSDAAEAMPAVLPSSDLDPVHSPDDPLPADSGAVDSATSYSSSHTGLDGILPDPDAPDRHARRKTKEAPPHVETAADDISVGKYYLDRKNWRAALSRFQSAMVLSPEEPEVYWGIAESQRNLGNLAEARANYQKLIDYDPGNRHAKDAAKALRQPEIANAKPATEPAK